MSEKLVSYTLDLDNLPPFTAEEEEQLRVLSQMSDEDIDYSDAPSLPDEAWDKAVRGRFYRGRKSIEPVPIEGEVLAWFRKQGDDYQTRINDVLRQEMQRGLRASSEQTSEPLKSA